MSDAFASPVVCNAGPLIGLARIGLAWLSFQLYVEIMIPETVRDELLVKDSPDREQLSVVLEKANIVKLGNHPDRLLLTELDAGEAAVILVALQLGLKSVIFDERKARRIATHVYGLKVKGSAGILVEAKSRK